MKSYVQAILSLYDALFEDVLYRWPEMAGDVRRDRIRFARMFQARGLQFVLLDLPKIGKHLDRCLDEGTYIKSGLPASKPSGGRFGQIPVFLRGLYLRVFECKQNGASIVLSVKEESDLDQDALCFLRQFLYACKKAKLECPAHRVDEAFDAFYRCESELPSPEPWWDEEMCEGSSEEMPLLSRAFSGNDELVARADQHGLPHSLLTLLDAVASKVSEALGPFNAEEWKFKHGNGAKSNMRTGEDRFTFPYWSTMLDTVFPYADYAYHAWNAWADATWTGPDGLNLIPSLGEGGQPQVTEECFNSGYVTPSARLIAIHKTYKGPRLIAPEPVENAWAQQCLLDYFYSNTARSWLRGFIRFNDQELSRELCRKGSASCSLATIDLSEASDRVTPLVVGCVFKRDSVRYALRACRTRLLQTPMGLLKLRKFSTMGSACTFPVESLVFLCVAIAGTLHSRGISKARVGGILRLRGEISVFGDDLIVPAESYDVVVRLLECLHFKVNTDKSFAGPNGFREACGVDAFRGVEVTPAYWLSTYDDTPESLVSCVEQSNNFYKKFLVNASEAIREQVKGAAVRLPLRPNDSEILGFASYVKPPILLKVRRNTDLQRTEMLAPTLSSRQKVLKVAGDRNLHQYFTEEPSPFTEWASGVREPVPAKVHKAWIPTTDWDAAV